MQIETVLICIPAESRPTTLRPPIAAAQFTDKRQIMAARKSLKIDLSLGLDKQVLRPAERRRIALKNRIAE